MRISAVVVDVEREIGPWLDLSCNVEEGRPPVVIRFGGECVDSDLVENPPERGDRLVVVASDGGFRASRPVR